MGTKSTSFKGRVERIGEQHVLIDSSNSCRALALSLEDQNSFVEESNAPTSSNAKAACGSGSTVHRSAKRRLDDDSDDEQQKKKQRMLHNKALSGALEIVLSELN
jgi:hypothetical protein